METTVLAGSNPESMQVADGLAKALRAPRGQVKVERFPDGEQHVEVREALRGRVVVVQSLGGLVGERLLELSLVADAVRDAGAARLEAVIPYLAYARQDRRARRGEAVGGQALARVVEACGFDAVAIADLHSERSEGWWGPSFRAVSALPALADAARAALTSPSVVVSPDLGGTKRAERVAHHLGLPLAVVHKTRSSATEVVVHRVLGDVKDRAVVLVDDLISTGGTLEAAVKALRKEGCLPDVMVLAAHALLVGQATERLDAVGVRLLVHADGVPTPGALPFAHAVVHLAPVFAEALVGGVG